MPVRFSYGRVAHVLLWWGLAVATLLVSIPRIYSGVTDHPLHSTGPLHTCDSYLKFATGVSGASKDIISIFQSTTASKRIIIFTRKDDAFSSGLGLTAAYLASPHPVRLFEINGTHPDNELSKMNPDEVAAVVLCRVNRPHWLPAGQVFGSGLEVVSTSEKKVRR
jgi:hypothetical protein